MNKIQTGLLVLTSMLLSSQASATVITTVIAGDVELRNGGSLTEIGAETVLNPLTTESVFVEEYSNNSSGQNGTSIVHENGTFYVYAESAYSYYMEEGGVNVLQAQVEPFTTEQAAEILPPKTYEFASMESIANSSWSMDITNSTSDAQEYSLDFFITRSGLYLDSGGIDVEMSAAVSAEIILDGEVIWSFGYELTSDGSGMFNQNSSLLPGATGPDLDCDIYGNEADCRTNVIFANTLDLGTLLAGATGELTYNATAHIIIGDYSISAEDCEGSMSYCASPYAYADFGDPKAVKYTPVVYQPVITGTPVMGTVAAPSTLALFGLGALGLFMARRRKSL